MAVTAASKALMDALPAWLSEHQYFPYLSWGCMAAIIIGLVGFTIYINKWSKW